MSFLKEFLKFLLERKKFWLIPILIVALYPLINSEGFRIWAIIISVVFLLLAFIMPKILSIPNKLWFKFGLLLGAIAAPIIMGFIFFLVVTPIAIIMKLAGKDLLKRKYDKLSKTYWIKRNKKIGTMKQQF